MSKQMLILSGPQGAGNHLWSKVFSQHQDVFGWKTLLENYWEPHRSAEPFAKYWRDPSLLGQFDWTQSDNYFTSISVPLGIPNDTVNPLWEPNLDLFKRIVERQGVEVKVAIVGRDRNILDVQQKRIRKESTLPLFMRQLKGIDNPIFLSYELLYLYKNDYVKSLDVNIPVDSNVNWLLEDDANSKYVHSIEHNELDNGNKKGIIFTQRP